jgi:hypothetical protein
MVSVFKHLRGFIGTSAFVLVDFLLSFIDGHLTQFAGIARRHVVLALQVRPHVVLFVRDVGLAKLARVFPISSSLRISLHHVCMEQNKNASLPKSVFSMKLVLQLLGTFQPVVPEQMLGFHDGGAEVARVAGTEAGVLAFEVKPHVVGFVRDMLAQAAAQLALLSAGSIQHHNVRCTQVGQTLAGENIAAKHQLTVNKRCIFTYF